MSSIECIQKHQRPRLVERQEMPILFGKANDDDVQGYFANAFCPKQQMMSDWFYLKTPPSPGVLTYISHLVRADYRNLTSAVSTSAVLLVYWKVSTGSGCFSPSLPPLL